MADYDPAYRDAAHSSSRISVVIATRGRATALASGLESLAGQTDSNFEVIVVSDGEDVETHKLSQSGSIRIPIQWYFLPESLGPGGARNVGAEKATGEWLLFMDDDATMEPGWISAHRTRHEEAGGSALLVMGGIKHIYTRPPHSHTERFLREGRWQPDERYASNLRDLNMDSGQNLEGYCSFNCSLRRDLFLKCGGFDVAMRPWNSDVELAHRLHRQGVEAVVAMEAAQVHNDPKDLVAYGHSALWHSGRLDVYRIVTKQQRTLQISALRYLQSHNPVRRLGIQAAWNCSGALSPAAALVRRITDRTGSRWFFRRWQSLAMPTAYWQGVRSTGVAMETLQAIPAHPLPVLALHGLMPRLDQGERRYHLSPSRFVRLLDALGRLGYKSVTAAEGLTHSERRRYLLTFDDGYENLFTELLPHIESYSLKPLVFLVADRLGGLNTWAIPGGARPQKLLSIQQILEMQRHGVEFGSHTCSHPWLPNLSGKELVEEIADSKRRLEDVLGAEVASFAYPFGGANARVRAAVAKAGYRRGFSIQPGLSLWDDPFFIRRIEMREEEPLLASLVTVLTGEPLWRNSKDRVYRILRSGASHLPESIAEGLRRAKRGFDGPY